MLGKLVWVLFFSTVLLATSGAVCSEFRMGNIDDWFPPSVTTLEFHVGEPVSLEVGDFDGDGWVDLIVGVYNAEDGYWLLVFYIPNTGDGHLGVPYPVAESRGLKSPIQGVDGEGEAVDLNSDGKLDMVTFYTITILENGSPSVKNYLLVLWGNGDGTFRQQWLEMPLVVYTFMRPVDPIAVGDFDGDGLKDIAYPKFYPPAVGILYNREDYTWEESVGFEIPPGDENCVAMPLSLAAGDFDRDGKSDLVVGGFCVFNPDKPKEREYRRFARVYLAGEGGFRETFAYVSDVPDLTPLAPALYITDLTGEGIEDLVITEPLEKQTPQELYLDRRWGDRMVLFRGMGGRFLPWTALQSLWGGRLIYLAGKLPSYTVVDLSLGGDLEIGRFNGPLSGSGGILLNDVVGARLADLDNDGWAEIIAAVRTWTENATRIAILARKEE